MNILYRDSRIECDEQGITIHKYYFPIPRPKRIRWEEIRAFLELPLKLSSGKYRIWGMGLLPVWYSLDSDRPNKEKVFVLHVGSVIRVAVTPDRPEEFSALLSSRIRQSSKTI